MGLMDKFKNMFTEEVEEEIEIKEPKQQIKKEVIKVEIPAPIKKEEIEIRKEEIKEELEKEVNEPIKEIVKEEVKPEVTKREEKFAFPVFFDDDEFEDLKPKEVKEEKVVKPYQGALQEVKKPEPVKKFKPTPVISPIYGVLDKNYKKDEIGEKKDLTKDLNKPLSIDDIRNKAYGTLADDLENSLEINDRLEYQRKNDYKKEERDYLDDIEDFYKGEDTLSNDNLKGFYEEEYTDKDLLASASEESDLFDLIDSMYRKDED